MPSPIDLAGFIDPHVHSAPDLVPRLLDDVALAKQTLEAGLYGVLLKCHCALTADRATLAAGVVPGIRLWGGLVLNRFAGGFNPAAVETALAFGAAEIWMPTADASNHLLSYGLPGSGLCIEDKAGNILPQIHEILQLIAEQNVILGTGHLSALESYRLARVAREHGVKKILITHPEAPFIDMSLSMQLELAALGCRFERTWVFTTPALGSVMSPDKMISDIKSVGYESTVLATDMGQVGNPTPVEGLRSYVQACFDAGFSEAEVRRMGASSIAEWLP